MMFDPNESIQLQGHTGPFVQYTHARIRSILRKAEQAGIMADAAGATSLEPAEREVIFIINSYKTKLEEAAREYSPSMVANVAYDLAKQYNQFYQSIPIFNETDQSKLKFRIALSRVVGDVLKKAMGLLGINVPERM
jgi:arginyl-tRNA synthetase